jgi:hypothetical protein
MRTGPQKRATPSTTTAEGVGTFRGSSKYENNIFMPESVAEIKRARPRPSQKEGRTWLDITSTRKMISTATTRSLADGVR